MREMCTACVWKHFALFPCVFAERVSNLVCSHDGLNDQTPFRMNLAYPTQTFLSIWVAPLLYWLCTKSSTVDFCHNMLLSRMLVELPVLRNQTSFTLLHTSPRKKSTWSLYLLCSYDTHTLCLPQLVKPHLLGPVSPIFPFWWHFSIIFSKSVGDYSLRDLQIIKWVRNGV